MYLIYKEKVVKELIVKSLLDAEIEKRGIKVSDEDIKEEMKSIIDKVGSKEELNKLLKQRGVSNSEFLRTAKGEITGEKVNLYSFIFFTSLLFIYKLLTSSGILLSSKFAFSYG